MSSKVRSILLPIVFFGLATALSNTQSAAHNAAAATGADTGMDMDMEHSPANTMDDSSPFTFITQSVYPPSYFAHPGFRTLMLGHMAVMILAWVVLLPIAVMLSIVRSRYTPYSQICFLALNGAGLFLGVAYNAETPDLYPENMHHKVGWVISIIMAAHCVVGVAGRLVGAIGSYGRPRATAPDLVRDEETNSWSFMPNRFCAAHDLPKSRQSDDDSGHGTDPNTDSLMHSCPSQTDRANPSPFDASLDDMPDDANYENIGLVDPVIHPVSRSSSLLRYAARVPSGFWFVLRFAYDILDRVCLFVGFLALCSGIATYSRFFEAHEIYSGLAHWIKGGIFFWYGILIVARWSGSFGDLGWAWNVDPRQSGWRPTAEFADSAIVLIYGATNIFLEHLSDAGNAFSSTDLEHISITVLFIGGGACGLLVESTWVRQLLNVSNQAAAARPVPKVNGESRLNEKDDQRDPASRTTSLNPMPALVILLLGLMMGSHGAQGLQAMMHRLWGNLVAAGAIARFITYTLFYLKPPTSILPTRPPTELLVGFCIMAGGLLMMMSSDDTLRAMELWKIDVMPLYMVTLGLVGLLMAWLLAVLALKGWAASRESRRR